MATPFVQGRLRGEQLEVAIDSECGHCSRPLRLEIDTEMSVRAASPGAEPMVFSPQIDWPRFAEPNIIHAY